MNTNKKLNMTMLCDFYELTMGNGYFKAGYKDRITHFDLFFRSVPDNGGYAIAAGLEQVIEYIQDLHFDPEDIAYLRGRKIFAEDFLDYLANFKFTGDILSLIHISCLYVGPYAEMLPAYLALEDYAQRLGLALRGTSLEEYLVGATMTADPQNYVTRIYLPIQEG